MAQRSRHLIQSTWTHCHGKCKQRSGRAGPCVEAESPAPLAASRPAARGRMHGSRRLLPTITAHIETIQHSRQAPARQQRILACGPVRCSAVNVILRISSPSSLRWVCVRGCRRSQPPACARPARLRAPRRPSAALLSVCSRHKCNQHAGACRRAATATAAAAAAAAAALVPTFVCPAAAVLSCSRLQQDELRRGAGPAAQAQAAEALQVQDL